MGRGKRFEEFAILASSPKSPKEDSCPEVTERSHSCTSAWIPRGFCLPTWTKVTQSNQHIPQIAFHVQWVKKTVLFLGPQVLGCLDLFIVIWLIRLEITGF